MERAITNAALRALRQILRASERGGRRLATATGMTPSQLLVLQEVERLEETTPTMIASALQFGQPTVTSIVDRLTGAGYLTRQRGETDRRKIYLRVTEAGHQALDDAPDMMQAQFKDRFSALPSWEQAMILSSLERLSDMLGATDLDAAPLIDTGAIDRVVE